MIKKITILSRNILAALFLSLMSFASIVQADELKALPAGEYALDLSHASIVWKVSHMGFSTYVGRFTDFAADLNLDTQDFTNSTVSVEIDVSSIATEYPWIEKEDFDETVANDWLKSEDNPEIKFVSHKVSELNAGKASIGGELTINGITRPVTLAITLNRAVISHPFKRVPAIGFSATATIDRTEWEVSKLAQIVGTDVAIEIEGEFIFSGNLPAGDSQ